jgi:hypothetical protein
MLHGVSRGLDLYVVESGLRMEEATKENAPWPSIEDKKSFLAQRCGPMIQLKQGPVGLVRIFCFPSRFLEFEISTEDLICRNNSSASEQCIKLMNHFE